MELNSLVAAVANPHCFPTNLKQKRPILFQQRRPAGRASARKILRQNKEKGSFAGDDSSINHSQVIEKLSQRRTPVLAQEIFLELKSEDFPLNNSTLSSLMVRYIDGGLLLQAEAIWEEMLNSCFVPSVLVISKLLNTYGKMRRFDDIIKVLDQVKLRYLHLLPEAYSLAISCFGKHGQLELMENTLREMVSSGVPVDSRTGNSFIAYYSIFGSLMEMETAYGRLKRSRFLIEKEGILAMAFAYIRERKFYRLGEFLRDVGLRRKNVGNMLWNLLLLSYAANFKMKSLQREFLAMVEAGFNPDITTFNIRAMAFSRMDLLWDLHLSLEHMKHVKIEPDLVTYGCVVDAYVDRRLGRNLEFVLSKMNPDQPPISLTDPFVFEALGKGDFHMSSEAFMQFQKQKKWTYRELISLYLKKQHRRDQVFWNY
ncbi:pentatricopeptide repeat-containing protein At3g42630 [Cucurbita moschata]|uniref:Pentatricopeptide repeat-containing protein At3g42630 n=1 Tax=Cucurbita moschata TaxID=3662 RepID=A0A6J1FC40_CUCMO|nr:pentatricopeptide repeat-containing protein At3g42630 [Cucurbita moschata]